jgi:hypothetical protein
MNSSSANITEAAAAILVGIIFLVKTYRSTDPAENRPRGYAIGIIVIAVGIILLGLHSYAAYVRSKYGAS